MIMKKKGFVDKGLYGLKDKLKQTNESSTESADSAQSTAADFIESTPSQQSNTDNSINEAQNNSYSETSQNINIQTQNQTPTKKMPEPVLDKEFIKALQKRKDEFIRTKKHVIDKSTSTLNKLPVLTADFRRKINELDKAEQAIKNTLNEISRINEKEWKSTDFSSELSIATKTVENARLQHLMLISKLEEIENANTPAGSKTGSAESSIIPELTSLKFGQLFKMGFSFFLPLIFGLFITAAIVSVTIFFVMGGF